MEDLLFKDLRVAEWKETAREDAGETLVDLTQTLLASRTGREEEEEEEEEIDGRLGMDMELPSDKRDPIPRNIA